MNPVFSALRFLGKIGLINCHRDGFNRGNLTLTRGVRSPGNKIGMGNIESLRGPVKIYELCNQVTRAEGNLPEGSQCAVLSLNFRVKSGLIVKAEFVLKVSFRRMSSGGGILSPSIVNPGFGLWIIPLIVSPCTKGRIDDIVSLGGPMRQRKLYNSKNDGEATHQSGLNADTFSTFG